MVDFYVRDSDDQRAQGANHLDDIDFVQSKVYSAGPWGQAITIIGLRDGAHACLQCGEFFDLETTALKPIEVKIGEIPCVLHRKCVGLHRPLSRGSFRSMHHILQSVQAKKFEQKATSSIFAASREGLEDSPLIIPGK